MSRIKIGSFTLALMIGTLTVLKVPAFADPIITGKSGVLNHGSSVTITGSGFGTKNPAKPLIWADFETGLAPTTLGIKTAWDNSDGMAWSTDCPAGGCAKAADGNGAWTLGVDFNYWTTEGQRSYIFRRQRTNFTITTESQNWKFWRMWPSEGMPPDIYASPSNGRVYVEGIGQESGFWGTFPANTTEWVTQELIVKASTMNTKNGSLTIRYNGQDMATGTLLTRSSAAPDAMIRNYALHGVAANKDTWSPAWSTNNRIWADDIYVDTSWSRVVVCEAAVFANCRKLAIQIPSAWSDTSITITGNRGGLSSSDFAYLYVFDSNGAVNAAGHLLCPACPSPPANLQVK